MLILSSITPTKLKTTKPAADNANTSKHTAPRFRSKPIRARGSKEVETTKATLLAPLRVSKLIIIFFLLFKYLINLSALYQTGRIIQGLFIIYFKLITKYQDDFVIAIYNEY